MVLTLAIDFRNGTPLDVQKTKSAENLVSFELSLETFSKSFRNCIDFIMIVLGKPVVCFEPVAITLFASPVLVSSDFQVHHPGAGFVSLKRFVKGIFLLMLKGCSLRFYSSVLI